MATIQNNDLVRVVGGLHAGSVGFASISPNDNPPAPGYIWVGFGEARPHGRQCWLVNGKSRRLPPDGKGFWFAPTQLRKMDPKIGKEVGSE